jgi:predicted RNA-binding Zn ribbon-like protein
MSFINAFGTSESATPKASADFLIIQRVERVRACNSSIAGCKVLFMEPMETD